MIVPMTEDIKFDREITIDAQSYTDWTHSVLPQLNSMPIIKHTQMKYDGIKIGDKYFYNRLFPKTHKVWRYRSAFSFMPPTLIPDNEMVERPCGLQLVLGKSKRGTAYFNAPVGIPVLADEYGDPWMSLTPNEVMSQRPGIKKARGTVLIGGCGMGWFARRVLERKKVSHVTIVDIDNDVLNYFGGQLKKEYSDRLTLVHDDIYNMDAFRYDSYLSDIWPSINDKPWDNKFQSIKQHHPNAWGWGYDL